MSERLKRSLVLQGSVLAIAGLISKAIGFIYRIPMANIMGNEGNGLYSVAFGIYNIALTLSSYSMPLAVSKLMSSRLSEGRNKDAHRIFSISFIFALIMGSLAWAGLLFGANFFAELYQKPGLQYPLFILAPTTFIVALLGTCRGYFQGHRNMVPTAVSQVLEQIVNAIVSVLAASLFVKMAEDTTRDFDVSRGAAGAAGGTMGTLAGAAVALLMFILLIVVNLRNIRAERNSGEASNEDTAVLWKALFLTVFPVIMSQTVYQLGYTIDDLIFGNIMVRVRGFSERETTILQGIFNTQYNQMINLPAAIAVAFSSAVLPSIVGAYTKGEIAEVRKKMDTVFRFNLLIAFPSALGLSILAHPIMDVLFPALGEYHGTAVILLFTGSSAVIFYTLSTLSASMLQGMDHMWAPVKHSAISLVVHVLILTLLLLFTPLKSGALVIGNVTFPMLTSILNIRSLKKLADYRLDVKGMLIKPLLAALVMEAVCFIVYFATDRLGGSSLLQLILPLIAGMATYIPLMFKMVPTEDLARMPIIKKFVKKHK